MPELQIWRSIPRQTSWYGKKKKLTNARILTKAVNLHFWKHFWGTLLTCINSYYRFQMGESRRKEIKQTCFHAALDTEEHWM